MATFRSALIDAHGLVRSVIMRDDTIPWTEPDVTIVDMPEDSPVGPGWSWDGTDFAPPPLPEEPE